MGGKRVDIKKEIESLLGFKLIRRPNLVTQPTIKDDYILTNLNKLNKPKLEKAIKLLLVRLHINPKNELLWATLGCIYNTKKEFSKSIKCFFKTIELNPLNTNNWLDLAMAYKSYGDKRASDIISMNCKKMIRIYCPKFNKINNLVLLEMFKILEKNSKQNKKEQNNLIARILNLNDKLISITKPKAKQTKKKILFINPPVEEPFIVSKKEALLNKPNLKDLIKNSGNCFEGDKKLYFQKSYVYNLPIGLLKIASKLLYENNEILFLDCFASLPSIFPNSKLHLTLSKEPTKKMTTNWNLQYFHLGLPYFAIEKVLKSIDGINEIYVGCTFTYHNESAHKVIDICKKIFPKAKVMFGGIYPTLVPKEAKKSCADEVFTGKYPNVENIPINHHILGYVPDYILIKGTKGCPHNCAYCAVHKLEGRKFYFRNPPEVFDEIYRSHKKYDLSELGIWDSNLLLDYDEYLGKIIEKILKKNLKLKIFAPEGVDYRLLNQKIANNLKCAGFSDISLALENIDYSFTKNKLNRQNNIKKFKEAIYCLKKAHFKPPKIRAFIMTGLPEQPLKNIINSIKFVWSFGCNVTIFPFTPIPGTAMYKANINKLKNKKLKELHPFCYPFVEDKKILDYLIELPLLNLLNIGEGKNQAEHFTEVICSKGLIRMLSVKK